MHSFYSKKHTKSCIFSKSRHSMMIFLEFAAKCSFLKSDIYTTAHIQYSSGGFEYFVKSEFEWEPLMLDKRMIPYLKGLDVSVKISQEQLCSSIRDNHATFLVKNTLFKEEVAWQPLKELQICSSSILVPLTRAFKWSIVCLLLS